MRHSAGLQSSGKVLLLRNCELASRLGGIFRRHENSSRRNLQRRHPSPASASTYKSHHSRATELMPTAHKSLKNVARPPRFERGTLCLEGRCSIQLSYGRTACNRPSLRPFSPDSQRATAARYLGGDQFLARRTRNRGCYRVFWRFSPQRPRRQLRRESRPSWASGHHAQNWPIDSGTPAGFSPFSLARRSRTGLGEMQVIVSP